MQSSLYNLAIPLPCQVSRIYYTFIHSYIFCMTSWMVDLRYPKKWIIQSVNTRCKVLKLLPLVNYIPHSISQTPILRLCLSKMFYLNSNNRLLLKTNVARNSNWILSGFNWWTLYILILVEWQDYGKSHDAMTLY